MHDGAWLQRAVKVFAGTVAKVDDRIPVPALAAKVQGKVFADRGSIAQTLFETLCPQGVQLIPTMRKGMKNKLAPDAEHVVTAQMREN